MGSLGFPELVVLLFGGVIGIGFYALTAFCALEVLSDLLQD